MTKIKIPWAFVKSTLIVSLVSLVASLGVKSIGGNFWATFCLFFTIQYILFSFVATIIKNYFNQKTLQKELDSLEPLSTILLCSYCNTANVMTFIPDQNERAEFVCTSCQKKNVVTMQFVVARVTEPINMVSTVGTPSLQTTGDKI
jgi:transcription elongation factor Elf1